MLFSGTNWRLPRKMTLRRVTRENKCNYVALLVFCLAVFGLLYYCEVTGNFSSKVSKRTGQIWNFATYDDEKVFLYKALLTKQHVFNDTNFEIFRNDLRNGLRSYFNNHIVMDQFNTPKDNLFTFELMKKSYEVQIPEDIHRLLPNKIRYGVNSRCSVVGNSGSLLKSKCGKDIDKSDFVFRCNAAPIKAFAADAGSQTNLTTFNPSIFKRRYQELVNPENTLQFIRDMSEYNGLLWVPCFSTSLMEKCLEVIKLYNLTENNMVLGFPYHYQKVQDFWESRGLTKRITTGLYLVTVAMSSCREVHLYGFWPFSKEVDSTVNSIPYHYFENMEVGKSKNFHDMNSEFSVLLQLHVLGVLKIHVGRCN